MDLTHALQLLHAGQPIAVPTETVYGLAADGLNPNAVARIFAAKERPHFDPLILHIADPSDLPSLAAHISPEAQALAHAFWPGGLTLVLPKQPVVPDLVTAGLPHVAVRCPAHPLMRQLLREFGRPLAAPSANRFGRISPTDADAVRAELGDRIPLILDGGPCPIGLESTIIDTTTRPCRLLRAGAIPLEAIRHILPCDDSPPVAPAQPAAPGLLHSHYAPTTPLFLSPQPLAQLPPLPSSVAALVWSNPPHPLPTPCRILAPDHSDLTAAANLFRFLRELDASGCRAIYADPMPQTGLGRAIRDRLHRASRGSLHLEDHQFLEIPRNLRSSDELKQA